MISSLKLCDSLLLYGSCMRSSCAFHRHIQKCLKEACSNQQIESSAELLLQSYRPQGNYLGITDNIVSSKLNSGLNLHREYCFVIDFFYVVVGLDLISHQIYNLVTISVPWLFFLNAHCQFILAHWNGIMFSTCFDSWFLFYFWNNLVQSYKCCILWLLNSPSLAWINTTIEPHTGW